MGRKTQSQVDKEEKKIIVIMKSNSIRIKNKISKLQPSVKVIFKLIKSQRGDRHAYQSFPPGGTWATYMLAFSLLQSVSTVTFSKKIWLPACSFPLASFFFLEEQEFDYYKCLTPIFYLPNYNAVWLKSCCFSWLLCPTKYLFVAKDGIKQEKAPLPYSSIYRGIIQS